MSVPDIRDINPYAAYNVTAGAWTVKPPELSLTPNTDVPQEWYDRVDNEAAYARALADHFIAVRDKLREGTDVPTQINMLSRLHQTLDDASSAFDRIHTERRLAFAPGGQGYSDFYNWRWQRHKLLGSGAILKQLAGINSEVHKDVIVTCFPGGLLDAEHAAALAVRVTAAEA